MPYCDFNSHVAAAIDQDAWRAALVAGLARSAAEVPGRTVDTVFFGGGTPSLMPPATVSAVIEAIARHWALAPDAEITLEANPTSVEAARFAGFAAAGVNRVSVGVQALNDADLKALGRMHDVAEALAAVDLARRHFARVSFDLIYTRQHQTLAAWQAELSRALGLGPDHLSLYQLTIEPGTRFGEMHARGRLRGLPGDGLAADLYALTQELCGAAGLPAYEVSNHARAGAEGRHNLIYWRYGDYAGIGPGAHGRLTRGGTRLATEETRAPAAWLAAGTGTRAAETPLSSAEQAEEYLLMSLRLAEGTDLDRHAALGGHIDPGTLARLTADGWLALNGNRLIATETGRPVLNRLLRELTP